MGYYTEEIDWIIGMTFDYKSSVDFVHSFNLKCDSAGWCTMKLENEDDFKLLRQIKERAKAAHGRIRFCYKRYEYDYDAEWYIIEPKKHCDYEHNEGIRGYKLPPKTNIAMADNVIVSQDFIDFCEKSKFTGISFEYVGDIGKYKSKEYFVMIPTEYVKRGVDVSYTLNNEENIKKTELYKIIDSFGGNLEKIAAGFSELQFIDVPIKITKKDEPQTDFCYFSHNECAALDVLVRKSAAEKLIENGLLKKTDLIPARYCDEKEHKVLICECEPREVVYSGLLDEWREKREKDRKRDKPIFIPNEKEGIKQLRAEKRQRSEDFNKALSKKKIESIDDRLTALVPFYKVTNGCYLDDEITMLQYDEIASETEEFNRDIGEEEVAIEELRLKNCVVIGNVIDGDRVVLREDDRVVLYNHEDFTLSIEYETFWHFILDKI